MPVCICTIGISFKENVTVYGQQLEVYKPMFLARVIYPNHFKNEYDRIKKMKEDSKYDNEDREARVEILDKATGKCGLFFNICKELAKDIIVTNKMYYAVKY